MELLAKTHTFSKPLIEMVTVSGQDNNANFENHLLVHPLFQHGIWTRKITRNGPWDQFPTLLSDKTSFQAENESSTNKIEVNRQEEARCGGSKDRN